MVDWSGKHAYQQVTEGLRERIAAGEFTEGGKLPSLAQLQSQYGASATVVRTAVAQLANDGLVVRHQGKAAFLTPDAASLAGRLQPAGDVRQLVQEVAELRQELGQLRSRVEGLEGR